MDAGEQTRYNKTFQPIGGRPMTAGQLKAFKSRDKYAKKEPIGKTGQQECARIFLIIRNENTDRTDRTDKTDKTSHTIVADDIMCAFYSINEATKCANFLYNVYKGREQFIIIRVLVYHKVHKWIREAVAQKKINELFSQHIEYKIEKEEIEMKLQEEPIISIKTDRKTETSVVYNPANSNQPLIAFNKSTYALTVANGIDEDNIIIERVNIYSRLTKNMMEYFYSGTKNVRPSSSA